MTLNDIRNKSGLLILVIGVGMLGFIFMDLMSSGTSLFQKGQNLLLKVGKEKVTYTSFEKELEQNINFKYSSALGVVNINQSQRADERDLLWDEKIKDILLEEKFHQSGITVGKTEAWDLISGEITGQQSQLFGFFFRDQNENGEWNQYDPEMIESWIDIGSDNPQWPRYLFFKENEIKTKQDKKYYSAIKKGIFVTQNDAKSYYKDQTEFVSGQYIFISNDNEEFFSKVSEKDIKKYYKNNKSDFPNTPNREVKYFVFNLTPSESDKQDIFQEMVDLISDKKVFNKRTKVEELDSGFQNTSNIEFFINQYGDNKYNLKKLSLSEFEELTKNNSIKNNIIQPYFDKDVCRMGRILNTTNDSVDLVYLDRVLYASDQTLNEIYSNVFDLINDNPKIEDYNIFSKKADSKPRTVTLGKMDQSVPGLGASRELVRWAFNNETTLNEPMFFDLEDKYIIAFVAKVSDEEVKPIEEVYDEIATIIQKNKSADLIYDKINGLQYNSLTDIANAFNVKVKSIQELRMNSDVFGSEGYNPGAVGAFFGAPDADVSEPYISESGAFVFKKNKTNNINYPSDLTRYKQLIDKGHDSQIDLLLIDILKEDKQIVDNRFNFY